MKNFRKYLWRISGSILVGELQDEFEENTRRNLRKDPGGIRAEHSCGSKYLVFTFLMLIACKFQTNDNFTRFALSGHLIARLLTVGRKRPTVNDPAK